MIRRASKIRSALLIGAAIAVVPASFTAATGKGVEQALFLAPVQPVFLTRELRRVIVPGTEIVSRRSYEIRFVREGAGWRVDGNLVKAEVDAPAELAMLAALEKARKDEGLFPLMLDGRGMIVRQPGAEDAADAGQARSVVAGSVEQISMAPADRAVASAMVQRIAVQSRAVGGNWPADLFRPSPTTRTRVQDVALPGGKQGRVTVTMRASPDEQGLLEQFERQVLTELDGTSRMSLETWRLSAQP